MEDIFEKADFTAGSDHKERLRKILFAATDSDKGTASMEELDYILYKGGTIMELSKELKEKVEQAESKEEVKKIIEDAGMVLDDAELDQVAGGRMIKVML